MALIQTILAWGILFVPFIAWRIWRWWMMSTFKRWKIPGPEPHLIHGNVREIRKRGLPQCHIDWTKKYGKVFGYYIGGTPIMVISDTEVLKQVLKEDFQSFGNRPLSSNGFMVNVGMESKQLIFTQNEQWKTQRTVWKSFFNPTNIKQLMPAMNILIDRFLELVPSGSSFDIYQLFQELTVDIMGRLMLGLDTDSLGGNQHPLITTFRGFLKKDSGKKFPVSAACFPEFEPLVLPFLKTLEMFKKVTGKSPIHEFIQQCSQHIRSRKVNKAKGINPNDLLQIMLDADTPEKTLIADCFSLLFGGYETTSITLAYAVDILSKDQIQQDKIRLEITDPKNASALTNPTNLSDTGLLGQLIEEVLRCYNPVPGFIRRKCSRNVKYGSTTIRKGTVIQVPMSCLHKDPSLWKDPEQFKPERFSSENRCSMDSLAHVPFGYGRRNCVAMQFAQTMVRLVLTRLLIDYRLLPPFKGKQQEIPVVYSIIRVVPSQGVYVTANKL